MLLHYQYLVINSHFNVTNCRLLVDRMLFYAYMCLPLEKANLQQHAQGVRLRQQGKAQYNGEAFAELREQENQAQDSALIREALKSVKEVRRLAIGMQSHASSTTSSSHESHSCFLLNARSTKH